MASPATPRGPLTQLTRARLVEFVRDPSAVFWVFLFPVLLAMVLGIAFREQREPVQRVAVVDQGQEAPAMAAALGASAQLEASLLARPAARQRLAAGEVDLVISSEEGRVTYEYDPALEGARLARLLADDVLQRRRGRRDALPARDLHVQEAGRRYIDFLMPGLIGLNLMGSSMWGLGYAVVDDRKRKLLKRYAATPMRRADFLFSFMLSRLIFLVAEVALLLVFGWVAFDVAVRGSLLSVAFVSLVGALSFSGLSVLLASRTASTETVSGWMNFVMVPMWLFSGAFFSYERFPQWAHPLIRALPLTAVNDALRAIMNAGASLFDVWLELAVLVLWGLAAFALALRIFRWQ